MNNLLNEDEFLKRPYSPLKRFVLFSILGFLLNTASLFALNQFDFNDTFGQYILLISIFIISPFLSFLSLFTDKKIYQVNSHLRNSGIGLIFLLSYLGIIIPAVVAYYDNIIIANIWLAAVILLGINMIIYSIVAGISGLIIKRKNKQLHSQR